MTRNVERGRSREPDRSCGPYGAVGLPYRTALLKTVEREAGKRRSRGPLRCLGRVAMSIRLTSRCCRWQPWADPQVMESLKPKYVRDLKYVWLITHSLSPPHFIKRKILLSLLTSSGPSIGSPKKIKNKNCIVYKQPYNQVIFTGYITGLWFPLRDLPVNSPPYRYLSIKQFLRQEFSLLLYSLSTLRRSTGLLLPVRVPTMSCALAESPHIDHRRFKRPKWTMFFRLEWFFSELIWTCLCWRHYLRSSRFNLNCAYMYRQIKTCALSSANGQNSQWHAAG